MPKAFPKIKKQSHDRYKNLPEFLVELNPERQRISRKRQFENNLHVRSEIKDDNVIALGGKFESVHNKLSVEDIPGALSDSFVSEAIKNKMRGLSRIEFESQNRQREHSQKRELSEGVSIIHSPCSLISEKYKYHPGKKEIDLYGNLKKKTIDNYRIKTEEIKEKPQFEVKRIINIKVKPKLNYKNKRINTEPYEYKKEKHISSIGRVCIPLNLLRKVNPTYLSPPFL